ncbi:MAG: type II toxin-antitoxin system RelE/ParE family toxin [Cytophagaceae bacterium]|nr:type II toxin-antitoxin system RelE/ParE family toxin [Cytophagaceae bacterium]
MAGATQLIRTDEAREEMLDIYGRLLDESEVFAEDWATEVSTKTELLLKFPEMGRMVPEKDIRFMREVFAGRYRIIYTYLNGTINVVAVRHTSRSLGRL